ncbi:hypothetical protein TOPH_03793 [Tolypocladium ophioglossoides CBS 100239]|uniref:Uncharacterized protein n=1 Tax=Tolypocladium ophioglossoides (strain CBS 100239) TaxID=1163406 RepID=A0A0L0NDB9_TOLOC|nr:hypothetical protein TOPH_03793 [Tolypocladium ophioglossoides CBS 100239]
MPCFTMPSFKLTAIRIYLDFRSSASTGDSSRYPLPLNYLPMDFDPEPLDENIDFSGSKSTPDRAYGNGGMVYWKDCPSVTLAKNGQVAGRQIDRTSGKGRLAKGLVLFFIGEGGQWKQD